MPLSTRLTEEQLVRITLRTDRDWRRLILRAEAAWQLVNWQNALSIWRRASSQVLLEECEHQPTYLKAYSNRYMEQLRCVKHQGGCGAILTYIPAASVIAARQKKHDSSKKNQKGDIVSRAKNLQEGPSAMPDQDECPRCQRGFQVFRLKGGRRILRCIGWKFEGDKDKECTYIKGIDGQSLFKDQDKHHKIRSSISTEQTTSTTETAAPSADTVTGAASDSQTRLSQSKDPNMVSASGSGKLDNEQSQSSSSQGPQPNNGQIVQMMMDVQAQLQAQIQMGQEQTQYNLMAQLQSTQEQSQQQMWQAVQLQQAQMLQAQQPQMQQPPPTHPQENEQFIDPDAEMTLASPLSPTTEYNVVDLVDPTDF